MIQYAGLFDLVQKGLIPAQKTAMIPDQKTSDKPEDEYLVDLVDLPAEIRPETKTPKIVKGKNKKAEPESAPAE